MIETLAVLLLGIAAVLSSVVFAWAMVSLSTDHDEDSLLDRLIR